MAQSSSAEHIDDDELLAFMICLHHLNPENKHGIIFSGSEAGVNLAEILVSLGVVLKKKSFSDLENLIKSWKTGDNILYVGGTNRSDPAKREQEHEKKKFPKMKFFYHCPVQNVKEKETYLLQLRPEILKKNVHKKSNCKPEGGFVYVLDTGL